MPGLSPDLSRRLRETLSRCGPFDSDRALRVAFVDARLAPWCDSVPEADSRAARVGLLIAALLERRDIHGNPALALFVEVLAESAAPEDACHGELTALAAELRHALAGEAPSPIPPPTQAPQGGKYEIHIHGGQVGTIGDNAHIEGGIHFGALPPAAPIDPEAALKRARRALAALEEQAAGYTSLTLPVNLKLELEDKRREVEKMERHLVVKPPDVTQPLPPSPFCTGGPILNDHDFHGRQVETRYVLERLAQGQNTSIVGERRIGKSSLLRYVERQVAGATVYLDLTRPSMHTCQGLMYTLRRRLELTGIGLLWRKEKDGDLLALEDALQEWGDAGRQILLLLDEVDRLTDRASEFNSVLDLWRVFGQTPTLNIITASRLPLADLGRLGNLVSPFHNIFIEQYLSLMSVAEWQHLVEDGFARQSVPLPTGALTWIENMAGRHPFYTQMAADALYQWQRDHSTPDYAALTEVFVARATGNLKNLWQHCTLEEQITLRATRPNAHTVAALERRGLLRDGQPFSSIFAQAIREGWWEK